ncbi:MAG: MBL fold metallo-hydrolase [Desulfobacter sp.]|nr:MBL fold metallo-hydrolase [Desulfobacter sp.]WDP86116.1 MAG: MBL fold metallo-hydrolase [Desulfobacter sp.]
MKIEQFRYSQDNLAYLVYTKSSGIVIDGGDPEAILAFARPRGIHIVFITNTHSHPDHTSGNARLIEKTDAVFMDCRSLTQGQVLALDNGQGLEVMLTPGHTTDSVCFKGTGFLVTGDTLFNATVGNCFSGDLEAFFHSLKQIMALDKKTKIFAGHDYVMESLAVALSIDPENPEIEIYKNAYQNEFVFSCLADELKVNPYLRFNAPSMVKGLEKKNLPRQTEYLRFSSIMEIY